MSTSRRAALPEETLAAFRERLASCRHCERAGLIPKARPVFQMPEGATIGLFSQAPGNLAHQGGRPFMDPSGVRLRGWMGLDEAAFYESGRVAIAPMAFCFPGYDGKSPTGKGGDLPPPRVCAEIWREEAMAQLTPGLRVVLLVGAYAQAWHMGAERGGTLTATVERLRERIADRSALAERPVLFPLPHPSWRNNAWLKRHPWFEAEIVPALRRAVSEAMR